LQLKFKKQEDEEVFQLQFYTDRIPFIKWMLISSSIIAGLLIPGFLLAYIKL
jgi:hypothetical protein